MMVVLWMPHLLSMSRSIRHYESELEVMQKELEESLKEGDYQMAHIQSEVIGSINSEISRFKQFRDPLYWKKQSLKSRISSFANSTNFPHWWHIDELKKILAEFDADSSQMQMKDEDASPVLENALINLVERKSSGFSILIEHEFNFEVALTYENSCLVTTIRDTESYYSQDIFDEDTISDLAALGFFRSGKELVLRIDDSNQTAVDDWLRIFSRIWYHIFSTSSPVYLRL
jgi:hypothetical protein